MKHFSGIAQLLSLSLFLAACGAAPAVPSVPESIPALTEAETTAAFTEPELSPEEQLLRTMSLREKVGQLFIIRPDALDLTIPFENLDNSMAAGKTELTPAMEETLTRYPVGGFIHFKKNIVDPDQISLFNRELSRSLRISPFLAVDEEGGMVARLANSPAFHLPRFGSAAEVGAAGPEAAQEMGYAIGSYLRDYGFNMDFAPVADVNTNPRNPVIGSRAFSSDPRQAALSARAMADGLRRCNILPVFKHFPGHGDTAEDSHQKTAVSPRTSSQLLSCEWIPFMETEDREAIMVGHIALPEVTGDGTPATFSAAVVTDALRGTLHYQGLIITDSLSMGAVISQMDAGEAALQALEAGCDILLMPASLPEAFDAVLQAVEAGSIEEQTLDRTVLRILRAKLDYHIVQSAE